MNTVVHCYHCNLPITRPLLFFAKVGDREQPMCCPGCKAVTEAIVDHGMVQYYQYRTRPAVQAEQENLKKDAEFTFYDREDLQRSFVLFREDNLCQGRLLLEGITCAACVWLIESYLKQLEGLVDATVNLSEHSVQIIWNSQKIKLSAIFKALSRIGYHPHPWQNDQQEKLIEKENKKYIRRLAVSGLGAMQVMMYAIALYAGSLQDMQQVYRDFIRVVSAIMATPVVFYAAQPFFISAFRNLKMRTLSMDVPISLAIGGAYIASVLAVWRGVGEVYFDSASMFTFFLLLSRYLELRIRHRASRKMRALNHLLPSTVLKKVKNVFNYVPLQDVCVGDIVRVSAGEVVPADGVIVAGSSCFNESALTGEYLPVDRKERDLVIAGSTNAGARVDIKVTQTGQKTCLAGILSLLHNATQNKPKVAQMANSIAGYFVGFVITVAVLVYVYWFIQGSEQAFWITLSVLVVTCPCALSLATPTAITTTSNLLQKIGVLVSRPQLLETLPTITHVVFDKTGTLTQGKLILEETIVLSEHCSVQFVDEIAAALESHSTHPIAAAFAHLQGSYKAKQVNVITGGGIEGVIDDQYYRIGSLSFCLPSQGGLTLPDTTHQWVLLSTKTKPIAWFKLSDKIRPEAKRVVKAFQEKGIATVLLSGDHRHVVSQFAENLNISQWWAEATPEDKVNIIKKLQKQSARVLMVGDGINDVPVLVVADASFAVNRASDLARIHSDGVLLSSNLQVIVEGYHLTQLTRAVIRQNIIWGILYNIIALPLACAGLVPPWLAAIGMSMSSLVVVVNSLCLSFRFRNYRHL